MYLIHYRAPDWLASSIASVLASTAPVEVTVVHNGGELPVLPDGVRVVESGGNRGFTGGANDAIADWLAGPHQVAVIGAHDLHVDPATMSTMLRALERHSDVGIVGPNPTGGIAKRPTIVDRDDVVIVGDVSGTCMMLRREMAEQVGGFDETFGSYVEDVEYCLRAGDHGWLTARTTTGDAHGLGSADSVTATRLIAINRTRLRRSREGRWSAAKFVAGQVLGAVKAAGRGDAATARAKLGAVPVGAAIVVRSPGSRPRRR